jgi:uncharacterized RDD family membrane protein YckC
VFTVGVTASPITSTVPLVSGEAVELDVRVARLGSRSLALVLDMLVQLGLALLLGLLTVLTLTLLGPGLVDEALFQASFTILLVVVLIAYPTLVETFSNGRSIGKAAMGLRVVREDGGPIRLRHAFTRAMVGVAVEWPGLLLPPLTWVVCLLTMVFSPRGKRLGDLAAGTLVIHERPPPGWGRVPAMPPPLTSWATRLDLVAVDDNLALSVRNYLARGPQFKEPYRTALGEALASEVAYRATPPPPPGTPAWAYLAAVLAERQRRAAASRPGAQAPVLAPGAQAPVLAPGALMAPGGLRPGAPSGWQPVAAAPADAVPDRRWDPAAARQSAERWSALDR